MRQSISKLIPIIIILLVVGCKKSISTFENNGIQEIQLSEVIKWGTQLKSQLNYSPEFLFHKAQKIIDKNKQIVRVPISDSKGYFLFMKNNGKMEVLFAEAGIDPNVSGKGQLRIIDFERKFVNIITYKNNIKDSLYSLNDKLIIQQIFNSNSLLGVKSSGQGCPEAITNLKDIRSIKIKNSSDGSIKCPTTDKPRTLGEIIGSLFDKAFGWISPFFSALFGPSISSFDWSNYIDPYGNLINADVMLYWHLTGMDMNSIINIYMDGASSVWAGYDFQTIADAELGLTVGELQILDEVNAEFDAADYATNNPTACKGTMRVGNVMFNGTIEHWLIQFDYINRNVGSYREYMIPGAGSTSANPGYADLVNESTMEMFEIKPALNSTAINSGVAEINHYVSVANMICNKGVFRTGSNYATRYFSYPKDPNKLLKSSLLFNGVVVYEVVDKLTQPSVVMLPQGMIDRIRSFISSLVQNPANAERKMLEFLRQPGNQDILSVAKGTLYTISLGIMVATIVEDVLTFGSGIWNDWQSFVLAVKFVKLARKLPTRSTLISY